MSRALLSSVIVLGLVGCKYDSTGIFIVYLPIGSDLVCQVAITENVIEADPPVEVEGTTDHVVTDSITGSDAIRFLELFENKGGNIIGVMDDVAYVGTRDGKTINLEWINQENSTHTDAWLRAGYNWTLNELGTVRNTLSLTHSKEINGYSGTWQTVVDTNVTATETDTWDPIDGPGFGALDSYIYTYLEDIGGGTGTPPGSTTTPYSSYYTGYTGYTGYTPPGGGNAQNAPEGGDCYSDPCSIAVQTTCGSTLTISAVETDLDADAFDSLNDAGQEAGL